MGIERTTGVATGVEIPENRRVNPRARAIVFPSVGRATQLVSNMLHSIRVMSSQYDIPLIIE